MTLFPADLLPLAKCIDADPNMYFPSKGDHWMAERAKSLCGQCPIVDACREWAIVNLDPFEDFGVWGGTTANERKAERIRRGVRPSRRGVRDHVQPHGTEAGYARHRRRNEEPCGPCREGNRLARARRAQVGIA